MSNERAIEELKGLSSRFLDKYRGTLQHKEHCEEEIFSANDFFSFIEDRITELKKWDENNVKAMAKKIIDDHKEGFEYLKGK